MKKSPALLCVLALAACSSKPPEPKATVDLGHAESAQHVADPFSTLKADEQRARDVQKVLEAGAAQRDQQLESADSKDSPNPQQTPSQQ